MKGLKLIVSILIIITACNENADQHKPTSDNDKYIGVYQYVYLDNARDLIKSYYIVLSETDNQLTGLYYGTSDEFGETPEGYEPGFFVASMSNIKIEGDKLRFVLNVDNNDFLTKTVNLKIKSTTEALKEGYKNWDGGISISPKTYEGLIQSDNEIIFKAEEDALDKIFTKVK